RLWTADGRRGLQRRGRGCSPFQWRGRRCHVPAAGAGPPPATSEGPRRKGLLATCAFFRKLSCRTSPGIKALRAGGSRVWTSRLATGFARFYAAHAAWIIRFTAAMASPPASGDGTVAKPIADAFG